MACSSCGSRPSVPWYRNGLPTIWIWGPFVDHEIVPADEIDQELEAVVG